MNCGDIKVTEKHTYTDNTIKQTTYSHALYTSVERFNVLCCSEQRHSIILRFKWLGKKVVIHTCSTAIHITFVTYLNSKQTLSSKRYTFGHVLLRGSLNDVTPGPSNYLD